ncbi:Uncharacterised protein [Mycobacteroides abscessus subsp. abscessus]|nr:Uncharacterised protein [Mycobacteroides abscessus subsp. abscessus]
MAVWERIPRTGMSRARPTAMPAAMPTRSPVNGPGPVPVTTSSGTSGRSRTRASAGPMNSTWWRWSAACSAARTAPVVVSTRATEAACEVSIPRMIIRRPPHRVRGPSSPPP